MKTLAVKAFGWGSVAGFTYVGWSAGPGTALRVLFELALTIAQLVAIVWLVVEDIEL